MPPAKRNAERQKLVEELLLESQHRRRFTQDSPVFADVWLAYFKGGPAKRQDLLLEPHHRTPVATLAQAVRDRLRRFGKQHRLAYAGEYVAVELTLPELLRDVLPLSKWWRDLSRPTHGSVFAHLDNFSKGAKLTPEAGGEPQAVPPPDDELAWWLRVTAALLTDASPTELKAQDEQALRDLTKRVLAALKNPSDKGLEAEVPPLWSVSLNRPVTATLWRSRETVKADAASRVFPRDTQGLAWAVVDSGIDATHPAFLKRDADDKVPALADDFDAQTIVRSTRDFTGLRDRIAAALAGRPRAGETGNAIQAALNDGLAVDWRLYEPLISIEHKKPDEVYKVPVDPHGTHVAGTIAGDWQPTGEPDDPDDPAHPLVGICPGLALYDLRVLDANGVGDEFGVLAALSFVRWRNAQSGGTVIHGVNMSVSLEHDVRNSACGRSPVCLEVERVHNAGVVVVTAAGNDGRAEYTYQGGPPREGYRTVSISDPGNTEVAITVGSTHRIEPHAYGVSYFSSRGPTGDGRAKPDLVAPGEKITAPIPGGKSARMDGTSMAAPHVSGAAALLMARHREFIGRPAEIKRVLCESATDLGRERHYQGHGMLDILRALQSA
jgi:subtilisin family serine protease